MKPVILALVSIALFGCGRPDKRIAEDQPVAGSPLPGDWAVVRFPNEPDNLNPIIASSIAAKTVLYGMNNSGIFDGLMQYDAKSWSFTKPLLAESYPVISDDHLVYTFTLRDGVKWHDGQPLTPGDILFSSKAMMSPYVDSAPMRANFTDLKDVELLNGRKIRFTFAKPNFMNVVNLGDFLPIVPKHVYDPAGVLDSLSYADIIGPKGRSKTVLKFAEAFN